MKKSLSLRFKGKWVAIHNFVSQFDQWLHLFLIVAIQIVFYRQSIWDCRFYIAGTLLAPLHCKSKQLLDNILLPRILLLPINRKVWKKEEDTLLKEILFSQLQESSKNVCLRGKESFTRFSTANKIELFKCIACCGKYPQNSIRLNSFQVKIFHSHLLSFDQAIWKLRKI